MSMRFGVQLLLVDGGHHLLQDPIGPVLFSLISLHYSNVLLLIYYGSVLKQCFCMPLFPFVSSLKFMILTETFF